MTELAPEAFRTIGPEHPIPKAFVFPYSMNDSKRRIAIEPVAGGTAPSIFY